MTRDITTRSPIPRESLGSKNSLMRSLVDHLFRQKGKVITLLVLWTAAMAAYLIFTPPSYEGQIQFLIHNNRAGAVVSPEFNNGPVPRDYIDETVVATEIQLLSNRDLLRSVVNLCGLAEGAGGEAAAKAVKKLEKDLKVSPVLKANMLRATYSSSSPAEVKAVLESLANGYLNAHLRAHGSAGVYDLFDKQATYYQQQLKELQNQLAAFHEQRNIVTLASQKDLNLRKLLELQAALKDTEAALVANSRKTLQFQEQLGNLKPRI